MTPACPLCKSGETRTKYRLTGYDVAVCPGCGFEFNASFRGGGGSRDMFSEDYYKVRHKEAFQAQFDDYMNDPSAGVYQHWLGRIEEHVPKGRILDVGSALGTFLKIAEGRGWAPQGVELSAFGAEFTREKRGIPVFNGDLNDYPGTGESLDVVTFWDSIEHVPYPAENLRAAVRLLRPGGIVLLTTDNFDCLIADVARLAYRLTFGRLRYAMERIFIDANMAYFTEATFRSLLESCGLKVVVFEKMEYPLDKIPASSLERLVLRGFYGAAHLMHREAQVTVLARKA